MQTDLFGVLTAPTQIDHATLNHLFQCHLSRNERNILTALEQFGLTLSDLAELIASGAVKRLDFSGQVHYERQVFPKTI